MSLPSGTKLGFYEIVAPIGAGGMGEVYRARDSRLGREVAIKLLADTVSSNAESRARFDREARTLASLNHPGIVTIFAIEQANGDDFIAMELVEGRPLSELIVKGGLKVERLLNIAAQIAAAVAAAHKHGIVHRDLKPANVMVGPHDRVKVLDFGIAKLRAGTMPDGDTLPLTEEITGQGRVVGTVSYMSPEQAEGRAVDDRSDVFSLGVVIYEMATGEKPFTGDTSISVLSSILRDTPKPIAEIAPAVPKELTRIVRRCLAKDPEDRYQSAADLRSDIEDLRQSAMSGELNATPALAPRRAPRWIAAAAALALGVAVGLGVAMPSPPQPVFEQLTFRRGTIQAARFAGDSRTIVFAAGWEGKPFELFTTRPDSREARSLHMTNTGLLAVSATDEMAVSLGASGFGYVSGTLARAPLAGGVPREVVAGATAADWSRDGADLAVAHTREGVTQLEFPVGHVIYSFSTGSITHLRVAPSGNAVAALVHPVSGDTAGDVVFVDRGGSARTLTSGWNSLLGLAWSPDGSEVWFSGTRSGSAQALHAVSLQGEERVLLSAPATLTLHDVSRDGRALVSRDAWGAGVISTTVNDPHERDLSWLDGTTAWDISSDGRTLLLEEAWEGGGAARSIYLRTIDGAPALRLGEGVPLSLSPGQQWVVAMPVAANKLILLPTGAGQPLSLPTGVVTSYFPAARWLPGDRALLFSGSAGKEQSRVYLQSIESGDPRPVTAPGEYGRLAIFPDGRRFVTRGEGRQLRTFSIADGSSTPVKGALSRDQPIVISSDARWLYVQGDSDVRAELARINLTNGTREVVRAMAPADPAGITDMLRMVATPDGQTVAYTYVRALSSLYLVSGLK